MADEAADKQDSDSRDLTVHEDAFDEYKTIVVGIRKDDDADRAAEEAARIQGQGAVVQGGAQRKGLVKIEISQPPVLEEDTDLRVFTQWLPLWRNYSTLSELPLRDRETRVSAFWQVCSKGFLRIITHTIGIRQDGGRDVDEIHQMIKNHLRSLRDQNVDLKELLNVTQTEGQGYVGL